MSEDKKEGFYSRINKSKCDISVFKDAVNPFAKSKYATLSNILNKVNDVLNKNNLLFIIGNIRKSESFDNTYVFEADLIDPESDKKIHFEYNVPFDTTQKNPIQGYGSMMTYAQRYIYGAVWGISFDEDDPDSGKTKGVNSQSQNAKPQKKWLNPDTPEWENSWKAVKNGTRTTNQVFDYYAISKDNREKFVSSLL